LSGKYSRQARVPAAPAAITGYVRVHQVVPSEVWQQAFSGIDSGFVGLSALMCLAADISPPVN
jgi:hypothetical protein